MAITITRRQTRTVVPPSAGSTEPLYRVLDEVTASEGIGAAIYVFSTDTAEFSHLAAAADMLIYDTDRTAARQRKEGYYRAPSVTRDFTGLERAKAFAEDLATRVKYLLETYEPLVTGFVGTDTATITSSDA